MKKTHALSLDVFLVKKLRENGVDNLSGWVEDRIKDFLESKGVSVEEEENNSFSLEAEERRIERDLAGISERINDLKNKVSGSVLS